MLGQRAPRERHPISEAARDGSGVFEAEFPLLCTERLAFVGILDLTHEGKPSFLDDASARGTIQRRVRDDALDVRALADDAHELANPPGRDASPPARAYHRISAPHGTRTGGRAAALPTAGGLRRRGS